MLALSKLIKPLIGLTGLLLLSACSHTTQQPSQIYLDPQPLESASVQPLPKVNVKLTVNDLRRQHYLVAIHHPGQEQVELVSAANNVLQAIYKAVKESLNARGVTVSDEAKNTLTVEIKDLASNAQQNSTNYSAITQVTLIAKYQAGHHKILRQYTASRRGTGSFSVDISQQQNQLNQTLNAVLTGLLTDNRLIK